MTRLPVPAYTPPPQPKPEPLHCKRGCCWTPFGHSTARDNVIESKRCHCHDDRTVK